MKNKELFYAKVGELLDSLLKANFIDKVCHLAAQGHLNYAKHTLLQERYELYQDSFDSISEYMLATYWTEDGNQGVMELNVKVSSTNLDEESREARAKVSRCLDVVRGLDEDSALNSILDDLDIKLRSSKFKLGF